MDRETNDGYTLEDSYWTGSFYEVEDELDAQILTDVKQLLWSFDGDLLEIDLDPIDNGAGGVLY